VTDDEPTDAGPSRVERAKAKAIDVGRRAEAWAEETNERRTVRDLLVELRDRDRDAFASVLGSAIALRLFLFTTALLVAVISLMNLLLTDAALHGLFSDAGLTGTLAKDMEEATAGTSSRHIGLIVSSSIVAFAAGRSLTKVLAACSGAAWRLDGREIKASLRVVARITTFTSLLIIAAAGLNRLRDAFGIAVATGSLVTNALIMGGGWFFLTLSLPKKTRDPGAMLPGAVLFGLVVTAVQWFMQFYLPKKIANASETMGSIGVAVATLGYLFLIGRLMAGCLVVNAVSFERFGSVSEFVFGLPVVRRLPGRFPRIKTFFDLEDREPPTG
jgi:uncharacterized BrkB/YihY/UPF0761 family membrane protein